MKVAVFCGGKGTRLREETESKPKPMLEIGGRPILWHIMKGFSFYGYTDFVLALGYKGQSIRNYFLNYDSLHSSITVELGNSAGGTHLKHEEVGWRVTMVDTGEETLKGYRLKRLESLIDSDIFILTYGDGVANVRIDKLVEFHLSHGKIGTVTAVRPPSRFGEMVLDGDRVASFTEKPQLSQGLINGGFFVLSREIFKYLENQEQCDFEVGALERLAAQGELMVYRHLGDWACMDTLRDFIYLNQLWKSGDAFWKVW